MAPIRFLCGCSHEVPSRKPQDGFTDPLMNDPEGFVICAAHRARRHGYRASHGGVDYRGPVRAGWTYLEMEAHELFGEMPKRKTPEPVQVIEGEIDRRERRDFKTPFEALVAKGTGKTGSVRRLANRLEKLPQP